MDPLRAEVRSVSTTEVQYLQKQWPSAVTMHECGSCGSRTVTYTINISGIKRYCLETTKLVFKLGSDFIFFILYVLPAVLTRKSLPYFLEFEGRSSTAYQLFGIYLVHQWISLTIRLPPNLRAVLFLEGGLWAWRTPSMLYWLHNRKLVSHSMIWSKSWRNDVHTRSSVLNCVSSSIVYLPFFFEGLESPVCRNPCSFAINGNVNHVEEQGKAKAGMNLSLSWSSGNHSFIRVKPLQYSRGIRAKYGLRGLIHVLVK